LEKYRQGQAGKTGSVGGREILENQGKNNVHKREIIVASQTQEGKEFPPLGKM